MAEEEPAAMAGVVVVFVVGDLRSASCPTGSGRDSVGGRMNGILDRIPEPDSARPWDGGGGDLRRGERVEGLMSMVGDSLT
jgi:hypothetical protein